MVSHPASDRVRRPEGGFAAKVPADSAPAMPLDVLYLSRNGLLEPLGQSQIYGYLRHLATHWSIGVIAREKASDLGDGGRVAALQADCATLGIVWRPQPFRHRPKLVAPAFDLIRTYIEARGHVARGTRLIHARSYTMAAVAWAIRKRTGTPFIFDMRALWPEELIAAGRLRAGSWLDCAIRSVERRCLRDAAAVISLTHAAVVHLHRIYPNELQGRTIDVVPTCADLERFGPDDPRPASAVRVHGCIGTITSGWFRPDLLAAWFTGVARHDPGARFAIVTLDSPAAVRSLIDPDGMIGDRLTICARDPQQMPDTVRGHDVSAMFFTTGLSKLGSSPTRMGEILATGLPIVANAGVGDVAAIIRVNRVGVLLDDATPAAIDSAYGELERLLADPDLAHRCRRVAEELFSQRTGAMRYDAVYRRILGRPGAAGSTAPALRNG